MPDKLIDIKFAAQFWFWSSNSEVVAGKRVLKEDSEKQFRQIYIKESINEGKIDLNTVVRIISVKENILSEESLENYMTNSISVLNVLKQIKASNLSILDKNNLIRNNMLIMPLSKVKVLESMIGKSYNADSLIEFIISNVTKISTSSNQLDDIDEFLLLAEKIFGDNVPYTKEADFVKKFYKYYLNLQVLYANNPDITSEQVKKYLLKSPTADSIKWSLKALKSLKIDARKKALLVDDIISIFEEMNMYSKNDEKCSQNLIKLLVIISQNLESYYLGNELIDKFTQKYDLNKIKKELSSLDPTELVDLKKYSVEKNESTPKSEDEEIISSDEEQMLKNKFSIDTYNKIMYILKNIDLVQTNKEEIIISIKKEELNDFVKYINSKFSLFFGEYYFKIRDMYEEFLSVVDNKEDLNEYLLDKFTINNLSLYLRWLLIVSPRLDNKIELTDILLLLKNKKAFTLYGEVLKNELKVISRKPESYLYCKEIIEYVKKIYKFDVYDEEHLKLPFSNFTFVGRNIGHNTVQAPEDLDLVDKAFMRFCSAPSSKNKKFKLDALLIYALNFEYHDEENDKYYSLNVNDVKKLIAKISKECYDKEFDKDIDRLINEYICVKKTGIKSLLMHTNSFNDVLDILKLKKQLKGEVGTFNGVEINELDTFFRKRKFYTENNYYSLFKFYEKIKLDASSYAYADEILEYYGDYISRKVNKIDKLEPKIEKIEPEDSDTFEYKIINRFMPTSSEEKKRSLTAIISGVGIVSLAVMTIVFATSPIKSIESCANSFSALLSNPSLATIKDAIGVPLLYFASIYESFKGFKKHRFKNAYEAITEEENGIHR